MNSDEKFKLIDAQGSSDYTIDIAIDENLPATDAIRRECNFYVSYQCSNFCRPITPKTGCHIACGERLDSPHFRLYFMDSVLRHYIKRTGRKREILLSVYSEYGNIIAPLLMSKDITH